MPDSRSLSDQTNPLLSRGELWDRVVSLQAEVERLREAIAQALRSAQVASAPHAAKVLRDALALDEEREDGAHD